MLLLLYGLRRGEVLALRWRDIDADDNEIRIRQQIQRVKGQLHIAVHHLRHTTATLLKNLRVPARDAQIILGHSRLAITLEIYTHKDRQAHRDGLKKISDALHGEPPADTL